MNESFPWIENQIVHRPNLAPWQKAIRDSLLEIGVSPFNGFTYDHLYGTKVGGTIFEKSGRRHTAAELLASANPDKIDVLVHATVQKIVFDTTGVCSPSICVAICNCQNGWIIGAGCPGVRHQAVRCFSNGSDFTLTMDGAVKKNPTTLMLQTRASL